MSVIVNRGDVCYRKHHHFRLAGYNIDTVSRGHPLCNAVCYAIYVMR